MRQRPPTTMTLSLASNGGAEDTEFFPMPRYWFTAEDDINLIQVQKDAFMLNWRRRDADYPSFARIKPTFDRYYTVFSDFVCAEFDVALGIASCELTYVNTIEQSEFWSGSSETQRVINSFWVPDANLQSPGYPDFNCRYGYQLSGFLHINIAIRSGFVTQQPSAPVLIFEINATGRPERRTKSQADAWFDHSHDTILEIFLHLTNAEVQRHYWGYKET